MIIAIIGATGYLGRHVLQLFDGHIIYAIIHSGNKSKGEQRNNGKCFFIPNKAYKIDKLFAEKDIDLLINCAGVYQNESNSAIIDGNLFNPLCIMQCAIENGVKNIVNINTSLPKNLNLYSFTKNTLGEFGKFFADKYNLNYYDLKVEMFYGPDEPRDRFISTCIIKMKKGEELFLTEGIQYRDLIRIEDVSKAIKDIVECGLKGYHSIPVGTGEKHTIRETLELIREKLNSTSKLIFGAMPMRDDEPDCIADMNFLNKIGHVNNFTWHSGIIDMIQKFEEE